MVDLTIVSTKDLVEELKKRESVNSIMVEPYVDYEILINKESYIKNSGASVLIEVID